MKRRMKTAACLCLCALLGVGIWQSGAFESGEAADPGVQEESSTELQTLLDASGEGGVTSSGNVDAPLQEGDALYAEPLTPYDAVWGGSYLDKNGRFVVWLTEDSDEARAEVFRRNPGYTEENVSFQKADYSLSYLTQLLAHISDAMAAGELPEITTAYVDEYTNRVVVTMMEKNAETAATVTAMDTLGGAVVLQYSSDRPAVFDEAKEDIAILPAA